MEGKNDSTWFNEEQRFSTRNRPETTWSPDQASSSASLFSALRHSTANEIKWLYPLQWSLMDLQYKSPRQVQSTQVHKHFQFGNCGSSKKPSFGKPWFSATFPSSFTDCSSLLGTNRDPPPSNNIKYHQPPSPNTTIKQLHEFYPVFQHNVHLWLANSPNQN